MKLKKRFFVLKDKKKDCLKITKNTLKKIEKIQQRILLKKGKNKEHINNKNKKSLTKKKCLKKEQKRKDRV